MSVIVFAIIVLIVAGLLVWAVDFSRLSDPLVGIVKVVIILGAALVILNRAGLL